MATRFFEPDGQPPPRAATKRVALVVGNGAYVAGRLSNPPRDAALVGNALKSIGFDTEVVIDADKPTLETAIVRLGERIERAGKDGIAFFYFAGHGIQHQGINYMVPVGTTIPDTRYLKSGAVPVDYLVEEFGGKQTSAAVIVLDACRDSRLTGSGGGSTHGLAAIQGLPNGMIIAFATAAGQVAEDGGGQNSPYASALAARLLEPDRRLDELFLLVARDVAGATADTQHPALFMQGSIPPVALDAEAAPAPHDVSHSGLLSSAARLQRPLGGERSKAAGLRRFNVPPLRSAALVATGIVLTLLAVSLWAWRPMSNAEKGRLSEVLSEPKFQPIPKGGSKSPPRPSLAAPLTPEQERVLKPGDVFKECASCPAMIVVPAGSFKMGSDKEPGMDKDETPQHDVHFKHMFAIGRFSVTFDEWDACAGDGGCNRWRPQDEGWGRGKRPVINVSWHLAQSYLSWLSEKTRKAYRLPSEAEREYATRARTTLTDTAPPFWFGASITTAQANYNGNYNYQGGLEGEFRQKTLPVDSFKPNPHGLYQVHGNVWEWIEDCWHGNYESAPADGSAWMDGDCSRRVIRGGSWYDQPVRLRSAFRNRAGPGTQHGRIGFRVVRPLQTGL